LEVKIAGELGYCAGVSKAIEKAMAYGDEHHQVYSLGTIAHNEAVVEILRRHGVEPIEPEEMIPQTHVAITAHGAPLSLYAKIADLNCRPLDCTCPIVRKAQKVVSMLYRQGYDILVFGDPGHQEVKGLVGWAWGNVKFVGLDPYQLDTTALVKKVGTISQTTQVPSDFFRFISRIFLLGLENAREVRAFNTICPIVDARVIEARKLAAEVDIMFVVGSQASANTNNLARVCMEAPIGGTKDPFDQVPDQRVYIVQGPDQVEQAIGDWVGRRGQQPKLAGLTAGTSTPIEVVEAVVQRLKEHHESHHDPEG